MKPISFYNTCLWPAMPYEVLIFLPVAVFIAKQCDSDFFLHSQIF